MEKEEYWATFLTSGKVTDYLSYRQAEEREGGVFRAKNDVITSGERHTDSDNRVKHNAGFY